MYLYAHIDVYLHICVCMFKIFKHCQCFASCLILIYTLEKGSEPFWRQALPQNNPSIDKQFPAIADSSPPSRGSRGRERMSKGPKAGAAAGGQHHLGTSIPKPCLLSGKTLPMMAMRWSGLGDLHRLLHQPVIQYEPLPILLL